MDQAVLYRVESDVAVLTIQNPPVNAISHSVRKTLDAALARALSDETVKAVVLIGAGRSFPSGSDIREFHKTGQSPTLPEVCARVENAPVPIIAAVHGAALGGGLELALAAHYRIALETSRCGFPEVTLGILPGAGGTQRAPRLVGAKAALDLMLSGRPVPVTAPHVAAFWDVIVAEHLLDEALTFARKLVVMGEGARPTRDRREGFADVSAYQDAVTSEEQKTSRQSENAPQQIVRCVEAALLLPFEQGMAFERTAFLDCLETSQSKALRHVFLSERQAGKFSELAEAEAVDLRCVGVVGATGLAASVAVVCVQEGWEVVVATRSEREADYARKEITRLLNSAATRGLMKLADVAPALARLKVRPDLVALADADLVLDCTNQDAATKRDVFAQLDAIVKERSVLVDAGPTPSLEVLALATDAPEDVLGLHLYPPLRGCAVAEVIVSDRTSAGAVVAVHGFLRKLGKIPVRARNGQIGPRMLAALRRAADYMVEAGATPYLVDGALRGTWMRFGPYQMRDVEGLEHPREAEGGALRSAHRPDLVARMLAAGHTGARAGKGFYVYSGTPAQARQDPEVIALIRDMRNERGITARRFTEDQIRYRCLAALANEGARLLREGIAQRPSDIDLVMIHAYGFQRWQGGPMQAADQAGLLHMKRELARFASEEPDFWTPDPIFDELSKNGRSFDSLNG
ncbi:enoyl-CoA hydratase-related protein [Shimia sp. SDUM112013]|uniref:enoyl-CoA hydratase-related protein n=1 Tax=Shimia sp. SDUM112013 TaxID=3136160 RepID=UPI0032EC62B4